MRSSRPLLTRLTVLTGTVGLLLASVLAQSVVLGVALALVPSVEPFSLGEVVVAFLGRRRRRGLRELALRHQQRRRVLGQAARPGGTPYLHGRRRGPGLLVVQLDGVSLPVLRQAITAGSMPTVSRWVRSGSHELRGWHTGDPGHDPGQPGGAAARRRHRGAGLPLVRQGARTAAGDELAGRRALVEEEMSTARGLLADGGASVSNLFSGDASVRLLTLSDGRLPGARIAGRRRTPSAGSAAALVVLFVGQMLTRAAPGPAAADPRRRTRVRRGGVVRTARA